MFSATESKQLNNIRFIKMKVNILGYKFFDENGGSFQLLVDEISLAQRVDYEDALIPHWIIDKGIPTIPPYQTPELISERIVAVCSCGEHGCDCITCQVQIEKDFVIFSDFERPGYSRVIDKTFKFTKENFQQVESQLAIDAEKIKKGFEKKK